MNKQITFLSLLFIIGASLVQASPRCIGYTENDFETGIGHDGPLRLIECGCECAKFERSNDNRCINCLHHQAGQPEAVLITVQED